MNVYKLIVKSDLYQNHFTIKAKTISDASRIAREKFSRLHKVFNNIKVSMQPNDLHNHINEIIETLHNA